MCEIGKRSEKNCTKNHNFINLRIIVKEIYLFKNYHKRGSKNNNGYIYVALRQL